MNKQLIVCLLGLAAAGPLAAQPPGPDDAGTPGRFANLDRDGDGRISREEARQAAAERSDRWFEQADRNKDGFLTQEELREGWNERRAAMKERMDEHFRSADTDGDGAISKSEAKAGMPMLERNFDAVDADKDGRVTPEEMRAHWQGMHPQRGPGRPAP